MNRTNLVFGVTLLLFAAVIAVLQTDRSEDGVLPSQSRAGNSAFTARSGSTPGFDLTRSLDPLTSARSHSGPHVPVLDTFLVEPLREAHPALAAQAERVQTGTLDRLRELTDELGLTENQQLEIFPLLARAHPDYNRALHLVGVPVSSDLEPLGKFASDRRIQKVLDPEQLLDLEILAATADVWWTDVISRLEKDLVDATTEPFPAGRNPEDTPTPVEEPAPPTPLAPPPSNSRGSNLFDLLQEGRP